MPTFKGTNLHDIRLKNRAVILKLVATEAQTSRADISQKTGLTKTTTGNVVADLISENIICETHADNIENGMGRKPISLDISPKSPCLCGMLVTRSKLSVVFTDLKGNILVQKDYEYDHSITAASLVDILLALYNELYVSFARRLIAIGIASVGPVDIVKQEIASPPDFYGIYDLPLPELISKKTGIPAYIIHDASAGALAEKVYGMARELHDFIYVQMNEGIGAGFILNGQNYSGTFGKSGEIGHTSINFAGPPCHCGNIGCLELYANVDAMNAKINHSKKLFASSAKLPDRCAPYTWSEIVTAAEASNFLAMAALDEFCAYVSRALANTISLFDINHVIVGYDSPPQETIVIKMLAENLQSIMNKSITVEKSCFGNNAPIVGAVALIANQLFDGSWKF